MAPRQAGASSARMPTLRLAVVLIPALVLLAASALLCSAASRARGQDPSLAISPFPLARPMEQQNASAAVGPGIFRGGGEARPGAALGRAALPLRLPVPEEAVILTAHVMATTAEPSTSLSCRGFSPSSPLA